MARTERAYNTWMVQSFEDAFAVQAHRKNGELEEDGIYDAAEAPLTRFLDKFDDEDRVMIAAAVALVHIDGTPEPQLVVKPGGQHEQR